MILTNKLLVFGDTAVEPAVGALHGFFHIFITLGLREVVECHVNVGTDGPLVAHGGLRGHFEITAVDVGFEFDTVFGDFDIW